MFGHNRFYSKILIFIFFFTEFSCQEKDSIQEDQFMNSFRLKKENEFLIHNLTTVILLDYFADDKIYLGYSNTKEGKEILLVDESGKIILNKNMQGEGPDQHSSSFSCLGFSEKGDIWVMTSVEVLLYDRNLILLDRFKYEPTDILNLYSLAKKFFYFKKDPSQKDITFATIPSGTSRFNPQSGNYFDKLMLFELYDQKSSSVSQLSPLSERLITKEFLQFVGGFYSPVYSIKFNSSKLILTSSFDNEINIYDLTDGTSAVKIPIYYEDPNAVYPSQKLNSEDLLKTPENWLLSPKNQSIHQLDDDLILLEYIMGVSINPHKVNQSEIFEDPTQNRLILFNSKKQLSSDIIIPEKGIIMTSIPGNRLLIKSVNEEKEDDFTRYFVYSIEEDSSLIN